jgi:hypothetical protein
LNGYLEQVENDSDKAIILTGIESYQKGVVPSLPIRFHLSLAGNYSTLLPENLDFIAGVEIINYRKIELKKYLWSLLPKKVNGAYKSIIGKPNMSDAELETQITLYKKKLADAKAGLDVFEGQALAKGITQEELRQQIIAKGAEFLQAEKLVNDRIELVRSMMEDNIDSIVTPEDVEDVKAKFALIDKFTISTPVSDIVNALKN